MRDGARRACRTSAYTVDAECRGDGGVGMGCVVPETCFVQSAFTSQWSRFLDDYVRLMLRVDPLDAEHRVCILRVGIRFGPPVQIFVGRVRAVSQKRGPSSVVKVGVESVRFVPIGVELLALGIAIVRRDVAKRHWSRARAHFGDLDTAPPAVLREVPPSLVFLA